VAGIQIVQADERDSNWEHHVPRFRVYLHGSGEAETSGWTDTYDITGADVLQVLDWAQRQAGGSLTYAIALAYDDEEQERLNPGRARGLVWLVGRDGNDDVAGDDSGAEVQRRMLARRAHPVNVPEADRMPTDVPDPYNDGTKRR
jgi:hypothetical protein